MEYTLERMLEDLENLRAIAFPEARESLDRSIVRIRKALVEMKRKEDLALFGK